MNNSQIIIQYILKYGTIVIFLLLFLEQLNFPGLASSILMPAIGVFVAKYEYSFIYVFILTLVAAILGSLTLYYLGYFIGNPMINWVKNKFPKTKETMDKILMYTNKGGLMMKILDYVLLTLVIIGAVNWGLIGFLRFDLVKVLFGDMTILSRIIYAAIGIGGLYAISYYGRIHSTDN